MSHRQDGVVRYWPKKGHDGMSDIITLTPSRSDGTERSGKCPLNNPMERHVRRRVQPTPERGPDSAESADLAFPLGQIWRSGLLGDGPEACCRGLPEQTGELDRMKVCPPFLSAPPIARASAERFRERTRNMWLSAGMTGAPLLFSLLGRLLDRLS
ncbi:MAG: hypothetical protein Q7T82_20195 [Armatimonadota bacterium]|nr:hypothetical protein [Armatimonadota bacterium]